MKKTALCFTPIYCLYLILLPLIHALLLPTSLKPVFAQSPASSFVNTISYLYDGDGKRIIKNDGNEMIIYIGSMEINQDINNGSVVNSTKYYYLNNKVIAFRNNQGINYISTDQIGSTRTTIDSNGTVQNFSYFPYGNQRNSRLTPPNRQFTGQISDNETGLYYYNSRYFNPNNGLFLSADILAANKTTLGLNRYLYTEGNPLRFTDNSGNAIGCFFDEKSGRWYGPGCQMIEVSKKISEEPSAPDCDGNLICRVKRIPAILIYSLFPFIGPEIAKGSLSVEEKTGLTIASMFPGPMAMTVGAAKALESAGKIQWAIRRISVSELDDVITQIKRFAPKSGTFSISASEIANLRSGQELLMVAQDAQTGKIAAYQTYRLAENNPRVAMIGKVFTDPDMQNKGAYRALMTEITTSGNFDEVHLFDITTGSVGEGIRDMYKKFGFTNMGSWRDKEQIGYWWGWYRE